MTKKDRYVKKVQPIRKQVPPSKKQGKAKVPWSNQYGDSRTWGKTPKEKVK